MQIDSANAFNLKRANMDLMLDPFSQQELGQASCNTVAFKGKIIQGGQGRGRENNACVFHSTSRPIHRCRSFSLLELRRRTVKYRVPSTRRHHLEARPGRRCGARHDKHIPSYSVFAKERGNLPGIGHSSIEVAHPTENSPSRPEFEGNACGGRIYLSPLVHGIADNSLYPIGDFAGRESMMSEVWHAVPCNQAEETIPDPVAQRGVVNIGQTLKRLLDRFSPIRNFERKSVPVATSSAHALKSRRVVPELTHVEAHHPSNRIRNDAELFVSMCHDYPFTLAVRRSSLLVSAQSYVMLCPGCGITRFESNVPFAAQINPSLVTHDAPLSVGVIVAHAAHGTTWIVHILDIPAAIAPTGVDRLPCRLRLSFALRSTNSFAHGNVFHDAVAVLPLRFDGDKGCVVFSMLCRVVEFQHRHLDVAAQIYAHLAMVSVGSVTIHVQHCRQTLFRCHEYLVTWLKRPLEPIPRRESFLARAGHSVPG